MAAATLLAEPSGGGITCVGGNAGNAAYDYVHAAESSSLYSLTSSANYVPQVITAGVKSASNRQFQMVGGRCKLIAE